MKHVDMRKLAPAAQEERRRQVIGLRQNGVSYAAIAAQVAHYRALNAPFEWKVYSHDQPPTS